MLNSKHDYFEVGNGSRRTLRGVPEMMDTPPIQNDYAFIFLLAEHQKHIDALRRLCYNDVIKILTRRAL